MSVQLNVNNPHFMIMQGKIATTIQMKPTQILNMIEEASGTSMYENKKSSSLKLIQKKQIKVDEITNIFQQEILPQLEKLRKEKETLSKYNKNLEEIESMQSKITAYSYH